MGWSLSFRLATTFNLVPCPYTGDATACLLSLYPLISILLLISVDLHDDGPRFPGCGLPSQTPSSTPPPPGRLPSSPTMRQSHRGLLG